MNRVPRVALRHFGTTSRVQAPHIRSRLGAAVNVDVIPRHAERLVQRKQKKLQERNMRPVKNASAKALIKELIGRDFENDEAIGPHTLFSDEELSTIFHQRNLRLKYKILGTSGNQLKDSLIVDQDVHKFLGQDEVAKAIWMARLGRSQGIFAYGTILKYLLEQKKTKAALALFNEIKKRGQQPDGRILNILFTGIANSKGEEGSASFEAKVEGLYSIFVHAWEKTPDEISVTHVNSLLKAIRITGRADLAIKLFDKTRSIKNNKRMRPDVRTYTEMFSCLRSYTQDFEAAVKKTEELFLQAQRSQDVHIDSQLIRSYSSVFMFANDPRLNARAITILREWYRICGMEDIKTVVDWKTYNKQFFRDGPRKIDPETDVEHDVLLSLSDVNTKKTKRFEPDERIVKRYDTLCKLFGIRNEYIPRNTAL